VAGSAPGASRGTHTALAGEGGGSASCLDEREAVPCSEDREATCLRPTRAAHQSCRALDGHRHRARFACVEALDPPLGRGNLPSPARIRAREAAWEVRGMEDEGEGGWTPDLSVRAGARPSRAREVAPSRRACEAVQSRRALHRRRGRHRVLLGRGHAAATPRTTGRGSRCGHQVH
jgi:hypothetical protein